MLYLVKDKKDVLSCTKYPQNYHRIMGFVLVATEKRKLIADLIKTVKYMRDAQKSYFKTRKAEDLAFAKDCENKVDLLLKAIEETE